MQFLYPNFLWALGVLAIPIIIHLFHFRRFKTVYFSNVAFLREVKEESATRNRLRHWLVLLSRLLFLTFLVLAFAQPFIPQTDNSVADGQRTASIYIDNSFSMDAIGDEVALLQRAKEQALAVVNGYAEGDQFQLLTNDFEGRHQQLIDREQFITYLDEVGISPARKTLEQVEERMELATSAQPNPDFYYISDFQANMATMEPDTGHTNYLLPIPAIATRNLSLDSVWMDAPVQLLDESVLLYLRIYNHGDAPVEDASLTLTLNGERKAIGDVTVPANNYVIDTMRFTVAQQGWNAGVVNVTDYPITFDDDYYFSFFVPATIEVLVINEEGFSPYFAALSGQQFLQVTNARQDQLNYATFSNYRLIVLNGLTTIATGLRNALEQFIEEGGNVCIYPARNHDAASYASFLQPLAGSTYGSWQSVVQSVGELNATDDLLAGAFSALPDNLLLPSVKGYFPITSNTRSVLTPIAQLENGDLFISAARYGAGELFLVSTPLVTQYTDLPKHALFVVLTVQTALRGTADYALAYSIGIEKTILLQGESNREQPYKIRGRGEQAGIDFIPPQSLQRNQTAIRLATANQTLGVDMVAGIYELYHDAAPDDVLRTLAFNYDRKESAVALLDDAALQSAFSGQNVALLDTDSNSLSAAVGNLSRGVSLWKLCLILALLFMGMEVLLLRLLPDR